MTVIETNKRLFAEFQPVTPEQWEEKIMEDLQGADYVKKLVWKTDEGIFVRPYYTSESTDGFEWLSALPGKFPFIRGNKTSGNIWEIRQAIETGDLTLANKMACDALARGATALSLNVGNVNSENDIATLMKGIDPTKTDIHYFSAASYSHFLQALIQYTRSCGFDPVMLKGSFDFDPLTWVLLHGDFYRSESEDFAEAAALFKSACHATPMLRIISINAHNFHNAGATKVQELGYSLAAACEYFDRLSAEGFSVDEIAARMQIILAAGSNYFIEIAALRAIRALWARMTQEFRTTQQNSNQIYLSAVTSSWNMTIYDPYVNMLRTTLQAMSAVVAGADSVTVLPFDRPYRDPDDLALRIARNQQIILKEEAYLDKVIDPAGGSYYIETLTHSLATHAWELFRGTEIEGGFFQAIAKGSIQNNIHLAAEKKIKDVASRRSSLVGTNLSPNIDEKVIDNIQQADSNCDCNELENTAYPFKKLKIKRVADPFEDLRLAVEIHTRHGNPQPVVFLLTYGNITMRRTRAGFALGFLGCAGYNIIDNPGFDSWEMGVQAVIEKKPGMVVICSSDDDYANTVPHIAQEIKKKCNDAIIVLAGYPQDYLETFRNAGVDEFIHVRSNLLETLSEFNMKLGIEKL